MSDQFSETGTYRVEHIHPSDLEASNQHAVPERDPDDQLTASVENVGVVEPPIGRPENGDVRLLDGVRRAKAAAAAGIETLPVLVRDMDDADALALSIQKNCAGFDTKSVADSDRDRSLARIADATDSSVGEVEADLGMLTEAERIQRACEDVPGVGPSTAESLADIGLTLEDFRDARPVRLAEADGVGETTAWAIWQHFDRDDGTVILRA